MYIAKSILISWISSALLIELKLMFVAISSEGIEEVLAGYDVLA